MAKRFIILAIFISLCGGLLANNLTKNFNKGILLSFGWGDECMAEHSGFPFFTMSCPSSKIDLVLGPMLCMCSMNAIAIILNVVVYSLIIFLIIIFLDLKFYQRILKKKLKSL